MGIFNIFLSRNSSFTNFKIFFFATFSTRRYVAKKKLNKYLNFHELSSTLYCNFNVILSAENSESDHFSSLILDAVSLQSLDSIAQTWHHHLLTMLILNLSQQQTRQREKNGKFSLRNELIFFFRKWKRMKMRWQNKMRFSMFEILLPFLCWKNVLLQ